MEFVLIDFGLAQFTSNPEHKAVDLYVLERAINSTHTGFEALMGHIVEGYLKVLCTVLVSANFNYILYIISRKTRQLILL